MNNGLQRKTFAEFFAGIGLVRKGLATSGWDCVYANDIDPKKKEIYDANFRESDEFDLRDVWEREEVGERVGAPSLVTASFPCIDLSVAGHYKGISGKHSSTFFAFTDVLADLEQRPKLVLLENVPGLLTANKGDDFRRLVCELAGLEYRIDCFVLDAKHFVPQSRRRVFVIGVHTSVDSELLADQSEEFMLDSQWENEIERFPSIRPARLIRQMRSIELPFGWTATPMKPPLATEYNIYDFIDVDDDQDWWDQTGVDKHYEMLNDAHRDIIDEHISSNANFVGTGYRRKRAGRTRLEVRFDEIAGCLRTPKGGSARQIVVAVVKGELRIRWMSPREYARLQGVADFEMVENDRQMLFGFGDAVCVPAIEWIDDCVLTPLWTNVTASTHSSL